MITKLLIANRGEIAVRVIRACRELGISPVAVFSEADSGALHVRLADEAVLIGPSPPAESYLRIDKILAAARSSGADAVHPGYGFLSEDARLAEAVRAAGLIFVGPPAEAMRLMGSKTQARALMRRAGVPVVPGYEAVGDLVAAQKAAEILGYPVLVKASCGGGGRGMRVVREPDQLAEAWRAAQSEAAAAFGDGAAYLERYIERARHIEFQIFGDDHGNVVHLFERECSLQRRHQKIIEEAPSPLLQRHSRLRGQMAGAAVNAARAVHYTNAGTVEFIVDPGSLEFYFLEMNTRLQVEHPVTELVTGLDLVHWQLAVAAGAPLPAGQDDIAVRGHALECRVYAEDPAHGFMPSFGTLALAVPPHGPGLRLDAGYAGGDAVSQYYDALLSKVIAYAPSRSDAIARMDAALGRYPLLGVTTNLSFLRAVCAHAEFQAGEATTQFVEQQMAGWVPPEQPAGDAALIAAAMHDLLGKMAAPQDGEQRGPQGYTPWQAADGFRLGAG